MKTFRYAFFLALAAFFWVAGSSAASAAGNITMTQSSISEGDAVRLTTRFQNTGDVSQTVLIDLELYNLQGTKLGQQFFDNLTLAPGEVREFNLSSTPGIPDGSYYFSAGIFNPNWNGLVHWYDRIQNFTLSNHNQVTPTLIMTEAEAEFPTVTAGRSDTLSATILSGNAPSDSLIDLEVYNAAGTTRVAQQFTEGVHLAKDEWREFRLTTPISLPRGEYRLKVGIFHPFWNGLTGWYDDAARFQVQ